MQYNRWRRVAHGFIILCLAVLLAACGRSIDTEQTKAVAVPGARGLHRFCDGPTLIYVSIWSNSDDEYEWFYPGGCVLDTKANIWVFNTEAPEYTTVPNGDSTDGKD